MNTKHTKGPWHLEEITKAVLVPFKVHAGSIHVAALPWGIGSDKPESHEEVKANATLIAAAPEMLEALEDIRKWYETTGVELLAPNTPICFNRALSVILKATGK